MMVEGSQIVGELLADRLATEASRHQIWADVSYSETRPRSSEDSKFQSPQRVWFGRSFHMWTNRIWSKKLRLSKLPMIFQRSFYSNIPMEFSGLWISYYTILTMYCESKSNHGQAQAASAQQGSASLFGGLSKKQYPKSDRAFISECST
jgi:hypothetical protein